MDETIFGKEPAHGWCYFYQKADLARQYKDWAVILDIEKQVADQQLKAKAGSEYLPFSEAYAATGDWEKAVKYIQKAYTMDKQLEKRLCKELSRYQLEFSDPDAGNPILESEMDLLDCP
jgi:tetratricopeptide (TPR) repeat protein